MLYTMKLVSKEVSNHLVHLKILITNTQNVFKKTYTSGSSMDTAECFCIDANQIMTACTELKKVPPSKFNFQSKSHLWHMRRSNFYDWEGGKNLQHTDLLMNKQLSAIISIPSPTLFIIYTTTTAEVTLIGVQSLIAFPIPEAGNIS